MINKETSVTKYTTVAEQSAWYAVDFEYLTTPSTGLPQLKVTLGDTVLRAKVDYITGPQGIQLVQAPEAGESLVIERDVPFVQDIDFQMGIIDPEQIESGLDKSVMRDQELLGKTEALAEEDARLAQRIEEVNTVAETAASDAASAVQTATDAANAAASASKKADEAKADAQEALDSANAMDGRITKNAADIAANTAAIRVNEAAIAANEVAITETRVTANQAKKTAEDAQTAANQATSAASGAQTTADSALSKANANETEIATIKQDQMDLGDQVHEIEAKIPEKASTTDQLVTQSDLAAVDALPSQTGNAGKFLTTNGTDASWAEVKQGGGIEWFREFTHTKAGGEDVPVSLRFSIPVSFLIDGHVYEFYMASYGLPYSTNTDFTQKTRYVRFVAKEDGNVGISGISYLAQTNEQSYTGNVNGANYADIYTVYKTADGDKIWFIPMAWEGAADSVNYAPVGETVKTNCVTKIHDITADTYIEPQDLEQVLGWNATEGLENLANNVTISREPIVNISEVRWGNESTICGDVYGISIVNFYTADQGWASYRNVCVVSIVERENGDANKGHGMYVFQLVVGGTTNLMSVLELHRSGSFSNRRVVVGRSGNSPEQLVVAFADKGNFNSNISDNNIFVSLDWYGQIDQTNPLSVYDIYTESGAIPAVSPQFNTESIYSDSTGDYVEKDQGVENAGKFLKVGSDGQVIASAESAGGGLSSVAHDATLTGAGTDSDPLKVADPIPSGGTAGQVLTKTADGSEWADASGGSGLPDQTGNAGKFLTTNGTDASWSDKPLTNNATGTRTISIGGTGTGSYSLCVGEASSAKEFGSTALGFGCVADALYAIQLGNAGQAVINSDANTFKVANGNGNFELMSADGTIPSERLAAAGTTGQVLSKTDTGMQWVDMTGGGSASSDNNGLEGDYCSKYGIVDETTSGLPRMGTGNQVIIPAGLVLDVPGVPGLTTNGSQITHDLTATTNCELWLANGNVIEVLDMFWSETEPEDGTEGFAGWWNGSEMKFKSNDTGNVWRAANAARVAKCVFTDGNLTRLCFTGCRLLNKQEYLRTNIPLDFQDISYVAGFKSSSNKRQFDGFLQVYHSGTSFELNDSGLPSISFIAEKMFNTSLTDTNKGATMADLPDVSTLATKTELSTKADQSEVEGISANVTALTAEMSDVKADIAALQADKADKSEIPDVSGFQTAEQVATIADTTANGIIADKFQVVDALPANPDANTFYFIKKAA